MSALPLFKKSWFESYAQFKLNSYFKRIQKHLPKDENNKLSDLHEVLKWEKEFIGAMYELFKEMVEFSQDSTKYPAIPGEELREAGLTDFFLPVETKKPKGVAVDEGLVEVLGEHKDDQGHNQCERLGSQCQSEEFIAVPISGQLFLQPVPVPELDGPELITLSSHSPYAALVEFDEEENQCTQNYYKEDNLLEPRPPPAQKTHQPMPKSTAQTYTLSNQNSEGAHSCKSSTTSTENSSGGTMVPLHLTESDDIIEESPILVDLDSSSESSTSSVEVEVGRQVTTVKSSKLNSNGITTSPGKRGVNTERENRNMSYTVATAENNMSLLLHNMAINYGEPSEIGLSADELTDWYATFTAEQAEQNSNGSVSSATQSKPETLTQGQNEGSSNYVKTEMENRSILDPHSNPFYAPSAPMEK